VKGDLSREIRRLAARHATSRRRDQVASVRPRVALASDKR